LYTLGAWESP